MEDRAKQIEKEVHLIVKPLLESKNKAIEDFIKTIIILSATILSILVSLHQENIKDLYIFKSIIVSLSVCILSGFFTIKSYIDLIQKHLIDCIDAYVKNKHGNFISKPNFWGNSCYYLFITSFIISIMLLMIYALSL